MTNMKTMYQESFNSTYIRIVYTILYTVYVSIRTRINIP